MLKIAVLVSGGGTNLQAIIDSIADGRITDTEIKVVISNNPKAKALERAAKAGIEAVCISPKQYADRELFNDALLEAVNARGVDLIVLAGFMVVVPEKMIKAYRNRMINIHPSLIPSFCGKGMYGLKVHQTALDYGVKVTGATVHFVNEVPDGGQILLQKAVEIRPGDTAEILQRRVMEQAEWVLLPQAAELVAQGICQEKENGK